MKNLSATKMIDQMLCEKFSFSTLIIGYRTREDLTQTEFADKLGVTKAFICDLEKKRRYVSVEKGQGFCSQA